MATNPSIKRLQPRLDRIVAQAFELARHSAEMLHHEREALVAELCDQWSDGLITKSEMVEALQEVFNLPFKRSI